MMEPHSALVCFCNYVITNQKKFSFSTSNNKIKEKTLNYNEDKTLISNTNFMINKANQSMLCLIWGHQVPKKKKMLEVKTRCSCVV